RRTVGAPLCGRRAAPPGSPRRGLCAVGWNVGAPRRSRCDAGLPPRTASRSRSLRLIVRELTLIVLAGSCQRPASGAGTAHLAAHPHSAPHSATDGRAGPTVRSVSPRARRGRDVGPCPPSRVDVVVIGVSTGGPGALM